MFWLKVSSGTELMVAPPVSWLFHGLSPHPLVHTLQVSKTLNEHISKFCQVTLESLAYAGTGDVLKVQQLLAMCGEHIETEEATAWKVRCQNVATCPAISRSYQNVDMSSVTKFPHFIMRRACTRAPP